MSIPPLDQRSYEVVEGWGQTADRPAFADAAAVDVDSRDRVHVLTRGPARVVVFSPEGELLDEWGEGSFTDRAHGITVGPDDEVWCVDDAAHAVTRFSPSGEPTLRLGPDRVPSDTGYDGRSHGSVQYGGGPFNRPTNLAVAADGMLFVTDGYGNSRVHAFSPEGELLRSWGEPGSGPGEFRLVHGIEALPDGRLLVADRENDRIQVFDHEGRYLDEWREVQRPTDITLDPTGEMVFVSELGWRAGQVSFLHGEQPELPSRVSMLSLSGEVLERWSGDDPCAAGNLVAAHGLTVDSTGAVYVAEVAWTIAISKGLAPPDCHTLQKFVPLH